jgi:hypothetical protein
VTKQNYDERMVWYGTEIKKWGGDWPFLSHDEEKYASTASETVWDRYFNEHLGGYPASYKLFKTGVISFYNVPDTKPELFDISYEPRQ